MSVEFVNNSAYYPGAASLAEDLDKKILLFLRDGRHLVGVLRSFDQYLNLVLEDTHERVILPGKYCDVPIGLYVVRGDNIVLCGVIDETDESTDNPAFQKITPEQLSLLNDTIQTEADKVNWDFES